MKVENAALVLAVIAVIISLVFGMTEPLDSYVEGYFHDYDNPFNVSISDSDVYYTINNFTILQYNDFEVSSSGVTAKKSGLYKIMGSVSMVGGNNGVYELEVFNDDVMQPNCAFFISTSTVDISNGGVSCFLELKSGNELSVKIKDLVAPAQNVMIYQMNFNIIRIM